ncbi:MAG: glycosyltransferase family 4 protein [Gammaproteobacteria bacterium]|nr:glycosyltransferase family 4 protein [Gammaproteobacteria bacterium]NIR82905.1 glycosyltransferase family 4 protein [Gammaproteobacteria bacterium]NIR90173.1 glycosyltransferase family 4 protein [Gammaproteobacteria bacterium]NIU03732.1 glycosyltransferase family 4 protein [Gammaproteobacteria bacterium]NIV51375.1 glycosyltransferase [Gammaproteobacteria bacterium]
MSGRVRVYGHALGHSSFTQVTDGFRAALTALDELAGFVPLDFYDEEAEYSGGGAPISVNTGMPSGVGLASALGHEHRLLMLAPNSDRIPAAMRKFLLQNATGLLTPTTWAREVLDRVFAGELPVWTVPHGLRGSHVVDPAARVSEYNTAKRFYVLHMTSTNSERKGTRLLLDAWRGFEQLQPYAELTVVCRYEGFAELKERVQDDGLKRVHVLASDGMDRRAVFEMFSRHHVVCQPSRAEGFGLVPLEAKAAGLPVVMTGCTGHADHVAEGATVVVETGEDAPSDDMPGARTPELTANAIGKALDEALQGYPALQEAALKKAADIQRRWSWENTTGAAMRDIIEEVSK